MTMSTHPRAVAAVALCFGAIVFDGYDLIVYGWPCPPAAVPAWGLTPPGGRDRQLRLFGMFLGAIASGTLTDLIGRAACSSRR